MHHNGLLASFRSDRNRRLLRKVRRTLEVEAYPSESMNDVTHRLLPTNVRWCLLERRVDRGREHLKRDSPVD